MFYVQLRPGWFVHENVLRYPGSYLEEPMVNAGYGFQQTAISPQRFGKPMSRTRLIKAILFETIFS